MSWLEPVGFGRSSSGKRTRIQLAPVRFAELGTWFGTPFPSPQQFALTALRNGRDMAKR